MRKLFFVLLILCFLAACSAPPPSAEPTVRTYIHKIVTLAPIRVQTLTPFHTITPLAPTAFATNEPEFATQQVEGLTPSFTPTASFEVCKWGALTSDGKWAVCDQYTDPVIFINQSNQTWEFSYQSFYKQAIPERCTELLSGTKDGAYIYFSLSQDCAMFEPWFPSAFGVFRIELATGKVDRILGENYDFQTYTGRTYSVSISPTGRRMAYFVNKTSPLTLNILDLKTGENQFWQLDEKYSRGGLFTWSKDGTKLVFLLASKQTNESDDYLISFAFLDLLKANSMTAFIHEKEFTWINAQVEITDVGVKVEVNDDAALFYNIETGVVSTIPK